MSYLRKKRRFRIKDKRKFIKVTAIVGLLVFGVVIFLGNSYYSKKISVEVSQAPVITPKPTSFDELQYSEPTDFYSKLRNKEPIQVLILGDSIGEGTGAPREVRWFLQLEALIEKEYGVPAEFTNISRGGSNTFGQLVDYRTRINTDYRVDLIIISLGQNDRGVYDEETFSPLYETLIRELKGYYPKAEIMPLIESSLINNQTFPEVIKQLSNHYDLQYVDLKTAFLESGKEYKDLSSDTVHPNTEGQTIYANKIFERIKNNFENGRVPRTLTEPILNSSTELDKFDSFSFSNTFITDSEGFALVKGVFQGYKPGNYIIGKFSGDVLAFSVSGGPEFGVGDVYVDGEYVRSIKTFLETGNYSGSKSFIGSNFGPGEHTVKVVISDEKHKDSKGNKVAFSFIITEDQ